MGHGQKNANRGAAINHNTERIKRLAEKHKVLGNIVKDVRRELGDEINEIFVVIDEMDEETEKRLRLLERPWWKKLLRMDLKIKEEEVEDVGEEETAAAAADAEPPASDSGPEDTGTEEEKGEV